MKKNLLYILPTISIITYICYYLYKTNANYDGGLIDTLMPFIFTMPIIACFSLWQIITGKAKPVPPQKLWQKILVTVFYLMAVAFIAYFWIDSKFYDLSSIIFAVLLVALIPGVYFDKKKSGKNPVLIWSITMCSLYVLIFVTVFTYIKVVSPITVDEATSLVAQEYGQNTYEFVGHIDAHKGYNPLGVYWFAEKNQKFDNLVEVDLLTGELNKF